MDADRDHRRAVSASSTAPTSTPTRSSPSSSSSGSSAPASASSSSTTGSATARSSSSRTRSSSPGATSAAAPRASTRRGRFRTSASRRSSRPSFADIFYGNCTKIGLLPVDPRRGRLPRDRRSRARRGSTSTTDGRFGRPAWCGSRSTRRSSTASLNGLDDIGVTLQSVDAIDAYEAAGKADRGPVTTTGAAERQAANTRRLGRGDLRPRRRSAGGVGGARCSRASRWGRRDGARRRLRQRPGDEADPRPACRRAA